MTWTTPEDRGECANCGRPITSPHAFCSDTCQAAYYAEPPEHDDEDGEDEAA